MIFMIIFGRGFHVGEDSDGFKIFKVAFKISFLDVL